MRHAYVDAVCTCMLAIRAASVTPASVTVSPCPKLSTASPLAFALNNEVMWLISLWVISGAICAASGPLEL